MSCECEFDVDPTDPDENTPETTWHYLRRCEHCARTWYALHCPHDGFQTPCHWCDVRPTPVEIP